MSSHLVSSNTLVTGDYDGNHKEEVVVSPVVFKADTKEAFSDDKEIDTSTTASSSFVCDVVMDEKEVAGVKEMIAALTQEEIDSFPDEHMPLRHFRAEKGDVIKATAAIQSTIQFRKEFGLVDIVRCFENPTSEMATILQTESETGKMYARGYDKDGRALMYMRPANENTNNEANNMRSLVFQLEKAIACSAKNGQSKICLVIDYKGFQLWNAPPMSTSRKTLDILQNHYPERMYRAYICNPPFVFRTFWALIQPFVDPNTKEKMCFCSGKKGLQKIVQDMGGPEKAHHLEPCAGGTDPLRPFDHKEYLRQLPWDVAFDEQK